MRSVRSYQREIQKLKTAIKDLKLAIRSNEWIYTSGPPECPFCGAQFQRGHESDCIVITTAKVDPSCGY